MIWKALSQPKGPFGMFLFRFSISVPGTVYLKHVFFFFNKNRRTMFGMHAQKQIFWNINKRTAFGMETVSCSIHCLASNDFQNRNRRMLFIILCFQQPVKCSKFHHIKILEVFQSFSVFQRNTKLLQKTTLFLFLRICFFFFNIFLGNNFLQWPSPIEPNMFQLFLVPKNHRITQKEQYQLGPKEPKEDWFQFSIDVFYT